jgi:hypothetical protein
VIAVLGMSEEQGGIRHLVGAREPLHRQLSGAVAPGSTGICGIVADTFGELGPHLRVHGPGRDRVHRMPAGPRILAMDHMMCSTAILLAL